jgi:hypothetical protein
MAVTPTAPAENTNNGTETPNPIIITSFPPRLGVSKDMPYMLIKIFETQTGDNIQSQDQTSMSLRGGGARVYNVFDKIASSDTTKGAAVGFALGGTLGSAAVGGAAGFFADAIGTEINTLLSSTFNAEGTQDYVSQAKNMIKNFSLKRNQEMLTGMIALMIPEGMTATYDQEYEGISITQALGAAGFLAQAAGSAGTSSTGKVNGVNPYLAEGASMLAGKVMGEQVAKIGTFATSGMVVNPQIELLYTSPTLRKFTLDFRLVPRNENEARILFGRFDRQPNSTQEVKTKDLGILNLLKYYSAPKIVENTGGRYFIPPAQFQLEFYRGAQDFNGNLFKTKNCVLESVNLDFGPNGFATHRDGVPVEVRMQLTFQETVMLDRTAILQGY